MNFYSTRNVIAQQAQLRNAIRRINVLESQFLLLNNKLTENNCLSNPCENGATCVDLFDGFSCKCTPNWTGTRCNEDVNECMFFVGTDLGCQNGATCLNTIGSYRYVIYYTNLIMFNNRNINKIMF